MYNQGKCWWIDLENSAGKVGINLMCVKIPKDCAARLRQHQQFQHKYRIIEIWISFEMSNVHTHLTNGIPFPLKYVDSIPKIVSNFAWTSQPASNVALKIYHTHQMLVQILLFLQIFYVVHDGIYPTMNDILLHEVEQFGIIWR